MRPDAGSRALAAQPEVRSSDRLRVALVAMPLGAVERPALGLALLQAEARRRGHDATLHHLAFRFFETVGIADYLWLSHELPYTAFAGDWLFREAVFGPDPGADDGYVDEVLRQTWQISEPSIARLRNLRQWVEPFLEECIAGVPWQNVDVVGFSSTFQQNMASLALAKLLADHHPHLSIVFGGANWEGEMGIEQHRRFPFVDVAFSGEADVTFPDLLDRLARHDSFDDVAGIVYRGSNGESIVNAVGTPILDLDTLAEPDFSDWFDQFAASPSTADILPTMLVETSRGCWWGAHSHCTFCGLNGSAMTYRSKSADRAFAEIKSIVESYGAPRIGVVDNILDMRYFRTLLPQLAEELPGLNLFYEVKANLTNHQIATLARAGVHEVQPGVESLSDHVLDLLRKGISALRNVQMLKWSVEHDVKVDWNILYGAPGETPDDYAEMLELIGSLEHLPPPTACGPIRLDRFSPYHNDPNSYAITEVRPLAPFRWLYPFDEAALTRLAYYFDFEFPGRDDIDRYTSPVRAAVQRWQTQSRGRLDQTVTENERVVLVDSRRDRLVRHEFTGWQAAAYGACDEVRSADELLGLADLRNVAVADFVAFVNQCVADRLMVVRQRSCLALAVRTPARTSADVQASRRHRRIALLADAGAVSGSVT